MEQLIALLIFAAVAFLNWMLKRQQEQNDSAPSEPDFGPMTPRRQARSGEEESEEERVRKFMEALGLPAGAAPPQPVQRRPIQPRTARTIAARREAFKPRQPQPVLPEVPAPAAPPLIREPLVPEPEPALAVAPLTASPQPAPPAPAPLAANPFAEAPKAEVPAENLAISLLKRPESLRTAFILREVLGPPRAMQGDFREILT